MIIILLTFLQFAPEPYVPFFGNVNCPYTGKPARRDVYVRHKAQRIHVRDRKARYSVRRDPARYLRIATAGAHSRLG